MVQACDGRCRCGRVSALASSKTELVAVAVCGVARVWVFRSDVQSGDTQTCGCKGASAARGECCSFFHALLTAAQSAAAAQCFRLLSGGPIAWHRRVLGLSIPLQWSVARCVPCWSQPASPPPEWRHCRWPKSAAGLGALLCSTPRPLFPLSQLVARTTRMGGCDDGLVCGTVARSPRTNARKVRRLRPPVPKTGTGHACRTPPERCEHTTQQ